MKRSLMALIPVLAVSVMAAGCGGKKESGPVVAKNFSEYTDQFLKFSVRYPSEWKSGVSAGSQAVFYSSPEVADGFMRYEPNKQRGAKIDVHAIKGGQEELNKSITELKEPFTDPKVFKEPEQVTLNGMPATKISYSFEVEDTKFTAERYYVMKDSVVTYLETAVIGERVPGLDMVSFGPQIEGAHSPDERVSIPTVERWPSTGCPWSIST